MNNHGSFTISLDLELYWGMYVVRTLESYRNNIKEVHRVVPELLELFEKNSIKASWAVVGFMLFKDKADLSMNFPSILPSYENKKFDVYSYVKENDLDPEFHFAPQLIERIKATPGQEVCTHTFSHYFCLENGQTLEQFECDLKAAKSLHAKNCLDCNSIVFPRNEYNADILNIVKSQGLNIYRGNQAAWFYQPRKLEYDNLMIRLLRVSDAYLNISGNNTYKLPLKESSGLINVPASSFLRPYSSTLKVLEPMRLNRIKKAMEYAAKNNQIYHLWWHPHNFGKDSKQNFSFLKKIINHYSLLHDEFGFQSKSMCEYLKPSL